MKNYKLYQTVIFRGRKAMIDCLTRAPEWYSLVSMKGRILGWHPKEKIKPLGYLLIKPTRNGQFRYHSVSWNNEKLQSSEPLTDKKHVINMAKFYFPDFIIIDKTK